jgi:hypothetical protein
MEFYFPDSQDQIDPGFDFDAEEHPPFHVRQRDDRYAHELLDPAPYSGMLVSKTMVDGYAGAGRYTAAQRHRLYRIGAREFFRLPVGLKLIGDCGGFSYVSEEKPPVTVSEVIDFYDGIGVDEGISVDHVILGYKPECDIDGSTPEDWLDRQALTLELAAEFLSEHQRRGCRFAPMGVAQGWSPESYAFSVSRLLDIGYERVALGGMVPLKTDEIRQCLEAVHLTNRDRPRRLHLLGVTRIEHVATFLSLGVTSFDSTSPFRQAFKDATDNFYVRGRTYVAIRIPPSDGNARLQGRIRAGQLDQRTVHRAEARALAALRAYDRGDGTLLAALDALRKYEEIHNPERDRTEAYRTTLEAQPWKQCPCAICRRWGVEVAVFRGTERNKRRGFHNVWVFNQALQARLAGVSG